MLEGRRRSGENSDKKPAGNTVRVNVGNVLITYLTIVATHIGVRNDLCNHGANT